MSSTQYRTYESFKDKVHEEGRPSFGRVVFSYTDASGLTSRRLVDIARNFENAEGHYCLGFCHTRQDLRTFLSANSSEVWDVENQRWAASLRGWSRTASASDAGLAKISEADVIRLSARKCLLPDELEALHADEAEQLTAELAMRFEATAHWVTKIVRKPGETCLFIYDSKSKYPRVKVYYVTKAGLAAALHKNPVPEWASSQMNWRVTPAWPQPPKSYKNYDAVLTTLRARGLLP